MLPDCRRQSFVRLSFHNKIREKLVTGGPSLNGSRSPLPRLALQAVKEGSRPDRSPHDLAVLDLVPERKASRPHSLLPAPTPPLNTHVGKREAMSPKWASSPLPIAVAAGLNDVGNHRCARSGSDGSKNGQPRNRNGKPCAHMRRIPSWCCPRPLRPHAQHVGDSTLRQPQGRGDSTRPPGR